MQGDLARIGSLFFDPVNRALIDEGMSRRLEPRSSALLQMLIDADGRPVAKEAIAERLWGGIVSDEAIVATVARLRRHLGDAAGCSIETIPKVGYRLIKPSAGGEQPAASKKLWPWGLLLITVAALFWWVTFPASNEPTVARARVLMARGTPADARAAERLLRSAATRRGADEAVIALAELYGGKAAGLIGLQPGDARRRAAAALAQAEQAGADSNALAVARGEIALQLDHDPGGALRWILGPPASEPLLHIKVRALAALGDFHGAAEAAERGVRDYPESDRMIWDRVLVSYLAGRSGEAVVHLRAAQAAAASPRDWLAALVWLQAGDRAEARLAWLRFYGGQEGADQWLALYRNPSPQAFVAMIRAMAGVGHANCADQSFAAAEASDGASVRRFLAECERKRHPLAPLLPRYPIFSPFVTNEGPLSGMSSRAR